MNKSDSIGNLAAALALAQGAMAPAKMDATNPFLKNKYADLGSVIQAAKGPLTLNGLSYTQHPSIEAETITVTTLLMHKSGEWIESAITLPIEDKKGLSQAQAMGAVITYLRRYSLSAILGVYADEDTDGNDKPRATAARKSEPEAEYHVTPEGAKEPGPAPVHTNGKLPERPWSPDVLKELIGKKAAKYAESPKPITDGTRGLMVKSLDDLFSGNDASKTNDRHQLMHYLTGSPSSKEISPAFVCSLLDWAANADMARREASTVLVEVAAANGQASLI